MNDQLPSQKEALAFVNGSVSAQKVALSWSTFSGYVALLLPGLV
jgi:hypothetical protein